MSGPQMVNIILKGKTIYLSLDEANGLQVNILHSVAQTEGWCRL